jgi:hypothetical protein
MKGAPEAGDRKLNELCQSMGVSMSETSARREILLKTDAKTVVLELGREGKFSTKASWLGREPHLTVVARATFMEQLTRVARRNGVATLRSGAAST